MKILILIGNVNLFYFPNSFSIIFLIALISVKVNLIPQLYIANTSFKFSTNSLSSFLCIIIGFSCDKIPHQLPDGEHLRTILFLSHLYSKWLHLRTELFIPRTISKRQTFTSILSIYSFSEFSNLFFKFRTISGNPRQFNYRDESAGVCISAQCK